METPPVANPGSDVDVKSATSKAFSFDDQTFAPPTTNNAAFSDFSDFTKVHPFDGKDNIVFEKMETMKPQLDVNAAFGGKPTKLNDKNPFGTGFNATPATATTNPVPLAVPEPASAAVEDKHPERVAQLTQMGFSRG